MSRTPAHGRRAAPGPAGAGEELAALEHGLLRIAADAAACAAGDPRAPSGSAAAYFDSLELPAATRDFLTGWWQLMAGAPPAVAAVSEWLGAIAAEGLLTCLAFGPRDGWSALAEALARDERIEVRLEAEVEAVRHGPGGVEVRVAGGERSRADAAVIAVPLNCLPAIDFDPPLTGRIRAAAGRNVGCAVKLVLLVRGVPAHGIAVGDDSLLPLRWWYAGDVVDGLSQLLRDRGRVA